MSGWEYILIYVIALTAGIFYFLIMFKRIKIKNPFQRKSPSPDKLSHSTNFINKADIIHYLTVFKQIKLQSPFQWQKSSPDKQDHSIKITSLLDSITGLALICWGQYLIALPGDSNYPISNWLNTQLRFDTPNLDNVLLGLPFLWAGCYLFIRALNHLGIFDNKEKSNTQKNANLPSKLFTDKIGLAIVAGLLFLVLLVILANNHYDGFLPVIWIVSILIFCILAWQWDHQANVSLSLNLARLDLLWITGLVLIGLIVVSFNLQRIPNQLMGDEGSFWTNARDIANGSYNAPVFGPGVYTFGILSSIYQGIVLKIFGINLWSWRFSSVLAGVIAIPPLYLLGRELFNRRVAVASSIAMFTAPYFLAFARLGYNNIQSLFIVTMAFYLFYIGYERKSAFYLFLAGCAAGLGTYTYNAANGAFYVILLFLGFSLFQHSTNKRILVKTAGIFISGWIIVSLPYSVYGYASAPGSMSEKPLESIFFNVGFATDLFGNLTAFIHAPRFVINQTTLFFSPIIYTIMLVRGAFRTLVSFNLPFLVTEHFIAAPLAGPVAVIFYTIGSVLALFHLRQRRFALLILWFAFNLFAFSIINTYPPRHQHLVGVIPVMALFIGLGMVTCIDVLANLIPHLNGVASNALLLTLVVGISISGVYNYFVSMPAAYYPDFEQIISWFGLYANGQSIEYIYNEQESSEFKPYILQEIRKDVSYKLIQEADFIARPEKYPIRQDTMLFYDPASASLVEPILKNYYGNQISEIVYINREGQPIGEAVWFPPMPIHLPSTLSEVLADTYLRSVGWVISFLALLLVLFYIFPYKWFKSYSNWLDRKTSRFNKPISEPIVSNVIDPVVSSKTESEPSFAYSGSDISNPKMEPIYLSDPLEISTPNSAPQIIHSESAPVKSGSQIDQPEVNPSRPFIEIEFRLRINLPPNLIQRSIAIPRPILSISPHSQPDSSNQLPKKNRGRIFLNRITTSIQNRISQEKWISFILMTSVLMLAFFGQKGLLDNKLEPGIWYLLVSGVVFLFFTLICGFDALSATSSGRFAEYLIPIPELRHRMVVLAALVAFANYTILQTHDPNLPYWDTFALWIISDLLFVLAFLPKLNLKFPHIRLKQDWKKLLPLAVILLIGFAVRFYSLGLIPVVMENDEGQVGIQALNVLRGSLRNMFQTWEGYGTLHFFIVALPIKLLGQTLLAIRLETALVGFMTLPLIYMLARKMFNYKVALVSTALLAVSHLDIQFSRISPSASSLDPFISTLTFLFIFYGLQSRRAIFWALAGTVMGLGLYFYVGARVLIFILIGYLILLTIFNRPILKDNWRNLLTLAGAYLIVATPMLLWAITQPDAFNARSNQIGIFQNGWLAAEMLQQNLPAWRILLQQFANSFLIFNYFDPYWYYNAQVPALGPLTGAAFVCGLMAALPRFRDLRFALLNCWFWVVLIIGQVLVVDPKANAYRTLGIIPAVCILAAVALVRLADGLFVNSPKNFGRTAPVVLLTLALVFEGSWNIWYYFGVWAPQYNYSDQNTQLESLIGTYLSQQPEGSMAYVADTANFTAAGSDSLEYQRKSTPFEDINQPMSEVISSIKQAPRTIFIFPPERVSELAVVQRAFPGGQVVQRYLGNQLYFTAYQK